MRGWYPRYWCGGNGADVDGADLAPVVRHGLHNSSSAL
jgi:hypothetical protein